MKDLAEPTPLELFGHFLLMLLGFALFAAITGPVIGIFLGDDMAILITIIMMDVGALTILILLIFKKPIKDAEEEDE